jgi:anti-sigma regulatory factor (Ser/Thr protein kinase)
MSDRIQVRAPLNAAFTPVVRLIVGGIAERAQLGFEQMDDLQLAIERLMAEAGHAGHVALSFELAPGRVRTRIGPLHEEGLAVALQTDEVPGALTLRRILSTVVDSFGVEHSADGQITVRLEKLDPHGAP